MPNEKNSNEEHGVRLSYKFRIYPTAAQCEAIKANIDASRFVYNHYLRARMDAYERTQQEVRRPKPACDEQGNVQYDQDGKEIWERTEGGKAEAAVAEIPSPIPADWDLAGISWNGIVLPKIGKVRARIHRIPEGKFVSCTVERKASGAYYASINVKERELPAYPAATGEVGITFGASHWAVTSDGQVMDLPERIGRLQRRLAIAQRDLARKEPGSQNYLKQKRKVARVNERIADVRKAATHNATRELVNGYGTIAARQMGSKDMQQHGSAATKDLPRKVKKMLNRKMIDGNFAEFNRQLAYKSAWANRSFVEVPGDTPTAQVCSRCGHEELVLARDLRPAWTCPECGVKHDRKANGAQNVLEAGKDILAKQEQSFVTKAKKSRTKKRAKQS